MPPAVPGPVRRATCRSLLVYLAYLATFTLVAGYGLYLTVRAYRNYRDLKGPQLGVRGPVYRYDPELGFAGRPGAAGQQLFPVGAPIPVRFSLEGFRIRATAPPSLPHRRPYVLALGCSFTYGDGCAAEDTYPEQVASAIEGTALNAGKCGYGLAHMLLLARSLVPRYRPEYVLAQHSFWLIGRGTSGLARGGIAQIPVPYLLLGADGRPVVHPPPYRTALFDVPVARYESGPRGVSQFLSFFFRVAVPLHVHDDFHRVPYLVSRRLALGEPLPGDRPAIERAVYREIADLCHAHGARLVIVSLGKPYEWYPDDPRTPGMDALFVDAQRLLDDRVPERNAEAYYKRFGIWRGDPPRLVDTHPNPEAHRITARAIVRALRENARGKSRGGQAGARL